MLASPKDMFEYDVAISFAGEQRAEAEAIADCLKNADVKVFYDRYGSVSLQTRRFRPPFCHRKS